MSSAGEETGGDAMAVPGGGRVAAAQGALMRDDQQIPRVRPAASQREVRRPRWPGWDRAGLSPRPPRESLVEKAHWISTRGPENADRHRSFSGRPLIGIPNDSQGKM